jgi:hypothetical protein
MVVGDAVSPMLINDNETLIITVAPAQDVILRTQDGDISLLTMMAQLAKFIECGNNNTYWNSKTKSCVQPSPGLPGSQGQPGMRTSVRSL